MREPTFRDAFAVLCLQAADEGRGPALFGDCMARVREVSAPFFVGKRFPEIYLEFPLAGAPFLDVTLLLGELAPGTRIDSPLAAGTGHLLDFCSRAHAEHSNVSYGFELDCKEADVPVAALHFQPRHHRELVRPFCEAAGEPGRADLYLAQDERMPEEWKLALFGMFRGRPGSPLRVSGYLGGPERFACASDPARVGRALEQAGFEAYDAEMLEEVAQVLTLFPQGADFQMDVYPDGSLGSTFALDLCFANMPDAIVRQFFRSGAGSELVSWLTAHGIADERAHLLRDISITRGVPVEQDDGSVRAYGFSLVPRWLKVRWQDGALCQSKMYLSASAGYVKQPE